MASLMIDVVLFADARKDANEQLQRREGDERGRFHARYTKGAARRSSRRTQLSIDEVMDLSVIDERHDEELYVEGVRRLVESLRPTPRSRAAARQRRAAAGERSSRGWRPPPPRLWEASAIAPDRGAR